MFNVNGSFEFINEKSDLSDLFTSCYGKVFDFKWFRFIQPSNDVERYVQFNEGRLLFDGHWERFAAEMIALNESTEHEPGFTAPTTFLLSCGSVQYAVNSILPCDWGYEHMILSHAEELPFYCKWCNDIMTNEKFGKYSPRQKLTRIVGFGINALTSKYDKQYDETYASDRSRGMLTVSGGKSPAMTNAERRMAYIAIWNESAGRPYTDSEIIEVQDFVIKHHDPNYNRQNKTDKKPTKPAFTFGSSDSSKRGILY